VTAAISPVAPRVHRRDVERTVAGEQLAELRALRNTMTEAVARLSGQVINGVLQVETVIFPADGSGVERSWHAPIGSVQVVNPIITAGHIVTVVSGNAAGFAPTAGRGVFLVRPNSSEVVSIGGHVVTFYGTPGEAFSYQAFTIGARPSAV
jgi:hypothetical protein